MIKNGKREFVDLMPFPADGNRYDTGKSPLGNERDYRLEDTAPKLPSIKEQLPEGDSGRVSQMLSLPSDSLSGTFGQPQAGSLFQFCDPTGPTSNKTPSQTFPCQGSTPEGFQSQASSHPRCSKIFNDPFQFTRHEKIHLRARISGEEDYYTQFTVEPATDESSRPRNLGHTILNKVTGNPLASIDHGSMSAKALQNFNSSDNNSSNETSKPSPNTSITTPGDIESDTNDTNYNSDDLPDDPDLFTSAEERITNPKAYLLQIRILGTARLFNHKTGDSNGPAQNEALLCLPASEYHKYQTDYYLYIVKFSDSELLLDLLAHRAGNHLIVLQEKGYCAKNISLLVQDKQRVGVVRVIQIEIQTILDLVEAFKKFMGILPVNFTSGSFYEVAAADELDRLIEGFDNWVMLTQKCLEILGIISILTMPDIASRPSDGFVWQLTTQVIELAILSYVGAHMQPFDTELAEKEFLSFHLPQRFHC
ncbi:hypothetical protein BPAE_0357g00060 [Botrytis paeoniae]|uniref:Uncharacterized protein n=1 Tax=Botrytis paeoniae TaxID=278948 RepID=A0A4Z1F3Q8_9HELO|nr:hypothetical protein BPAE_0357g00060 [Botrytis paeoniae]